MIHYARLHLHMRAISGGDDSWIAKANETVVIKQEGPLRLRTAPDLRSNRTGNAVQVLGADANKLCRRAAPGQNESLRVSVTENVGAITPATHRQVGTGLDRIGCSSLRAELELEAAAGRLRIEESYRQGQRRQCLLVGDFGRLAAAVIGKSRIYAARPGTGFGQASNSSRTRSTGSPTTLLYDPEISSMTSSPCSWIAYAPALSSG